MTSTQSDPDTRARWIIIVVFTVLSYILLWKTGFMGFSLKGALAFVLPPIAFYFFTLGERPVEIVFILAILFILLVIGLPVFNAIQKRELRKQNLREQPVKEQQTPQQ